jgi:hypothetical protein
MITYRGGMVRMIPTAIPSNDFITAVVTGGGDVGVGAVIVGDGGVVVFVGCGGGDIVGVVAGRVIVSDSDDVSVVVGVGVGCSGVVIGDVGGIVTFFVGCSGDKIVGSDGAVVVINISEATVTSSSSFSTG